LFLDFIFLYCSILFFFNATSTTEIYTLSLHDALPIFALGIGQTLHHHVEIDRRHDAVAIFLLDQRLPRRPVDHHQFVEAVDQGIDRKSTRLNSSHLGISYAVFCLKKKKNKIIKIKYYK